VPAAGTNCSTTANTNARRFLSGINAAQGAYFTQVTEAYTGMGSNFNGLLFTVQHRFSQYFTLLSTTPIRTASPVLQKMETMPETNFRIPLTPTGITATAALTCVTTS